jgi:hypothetical protein
MKFRIFSLFLIKLHPRKRKFISFEKKKFGSNLSTGTYYSFAIASTLTLCEFWIWWECCVGCTGFHQCRWGYRNVSTDRSVVANFKKARIPLDTMWNDIDYAASGDRDFTNDPIRFALTDWRSFVDELHANGQHYVILIDPGVGLSFV